MWETWANHLLPKALKSCPKSNKSPNLVTLAEEERGGREREGGGSFGGIKNENVLMRC